MSPAAARNPLLVGALALGALLQAYLFVNAVLPALSSVRGKLDRFVAEEPSEPLNPQMIAYRTLPKLVDLIPPTAPTLLITPLYDPIQYEFYTVPRPFRLLLQMPPDATIELIAQQLPEHAHLLRMRHRLANERRIVFTADRFGEELARSEFLLVFAWPEFDPATAQRRLELLATEGPAVLYAVRPD